MSEFVMVKRELLDDDGLEAIQKWAAQQDQTINIGPVQDDFDEHIESTAGYAVRIMKGLRAVLAQEAGRGECTTCGGSKIIDDGELTHSSGGIPYTNGPIKLVKDCPNCISPPAPVAVDALEQRNADLLATLATAQNTLALARWLAESAERRNAVMRGLLEEARIYPLEHACATAHWPAQELVDRIDAALNLNPKES